MRFEQHPTHFVVEEWDGNPDSIEAIRRWRGDVGFHRFSVCVDYGVRLIVELWGGYEWYVLGRVRGGIPELPHWSAKGIHCRIGAALQKALRSMLSPEGWLPNTAYHWWAFGGELWLAESADE